MEDEPVADVRNLRGKAVIVAVLAIGALVAGFLYLRRSVDARTAEIEAELARVELDLTEGRSGFAKDDLAHLAIPVAPWYASSDARAKLRSFPVRREALIAEDGYLERLIAQEEKLPNLAMYCADMCQAPAAVEPSLVEIEAFLIETPPTDLNVGRRSALDEQAKAYRAAQEKAHAYLRWLGGVVDAVRAHTHRHELVLAARAIDDAKATSPDPDDVVLPALARALQVGDGFADGSAWDTKLARAADDAVAWRQARRLHTIGGYRGFESHHADSVFAPALEEARADLEIAAMKASGNYDELPAPTRTGRGHAGAYTTVRLENSTPYTLTVRYSGSDTQLIVLAAGQRGELKLLNGSYEVAAMTSASTVRGYLGNATLAGGDYVGRFYTGE